MSLSQGPNMQQHKDQKKDLKNILQKGLECSMADVVGILMSQQCTSLTESLETLLPSLVQALVPSNLHIMTGFCVPVLWQSLTFELPLSRRSLGPLFRLRAHSPSIEQGRQAKLPWAIHCCTLCLGHHAGDERYLTCQCPALQHIRQYHASIF